MASFSKWNAKQDPRTELHDVLGLTGAEIRMTFSPAGVRMKAASRPSYFPSL